MSKTVINAIFEAIEVELMEIEAYKFPEACQHIMLIRDLLTELKMWIEEG